MSEQAFVRKASGLVRTLSWWDSFGIGFAQVVLGVGMVFVYYATPSTLPHASIPGGLLILLVVLLPILIVYSQLAFAMPRSGGDYVYNSRILHPAIGFMTNWLAVFVVVLNLPMFSDMVTTWPLPSLLTDLGYAQLASAFSDLTVRFVVDSILMILVTAMLIVPLKTYAKIQTVLVLFALVSPFVMLGAISIGHDAFVSMWNAASPISYDAVLSSAKDAGFATPTIDVTQTAMSAILFGFYLFTVGPVHIAGELKDIKKSIFGGVLGAVMFSWLIFFVGAIVYMNTLGFDFANALIFLRAKSPVNPPLLNSIIGFVYHNPLLSAVIDLSLMAGAFVVITTSMLIISRWIFAWAFDRIAPMKLAEVHSKYHTPYITILILWVVGELLLIAVLYTGVIGAILNAALGLAIFFIPGLVSGTVFPYRKKQLFESSPEFTKKKIAGIPLITICGAISTIGVLVILVVVLANPQLGFPLTPMSGAFMIGYWFLGLVIYLIAYAYRKSQGIDIGAAFKEIPPE